MEAIIYKHGDNDFELWQLDSPTKVLTEIEVILDRYRDTGCSVRGTAEEIANESKDA